MHGLIISLLIFYAPLSFGQSSTCQENVDRVLSSARWYLGEVYDIDHMQIEVDSDDLCEQMRFDNLVGFNMAFERALDAIFFDRVHVESPLALFIDWVTHGGHYDALTQDDADDIARQELREYLDRPTSVLRLLRLEQRPEGGESPWYNWIFQLKIPEFSDHLFWTVEDRRGEEDVYIYGFN